MAMYNNDNTNNNPLINKITNEQKKGKTPRTASTGSYQLHGYRREDGDRFFNVGDPTIIETHPGIPIGGPVQANWFQPTAAGMTVFEYESQTLYTNLGSPQPGDYVRVMVNNTRSVCYRYEGYLTADYDGAHPWPGTAVVGGTNGWTYHWSGLVPGTSSTIVSNLFLSGANPPTQTPQQLLFVQATKFGYNNLTNNLWGANVGGWPNAKMSGRWDNPTGVNYAIAPHMGTPSTWLPTTYSNGSPNPGCCFSTLQSCTCTTGCAFIITISGIGNWPASAIGVPDGQITWNWYGDSNCTATHTQIITNLTTSVVESIVQVNSNGTTGSPNQATMANAVGGDDYELCLSMDGDQDCRDCHTINMPTTSCVDRNPILDPAITTDPTTLGGIDGTVLITFAYYNFFGAQVGGPVGAGCLLNYQLEVETSPGVWTPIGAASGSYNNNTQLSWSGGAFSTLAGGSYSFTIIDCNGCTDQIFFNLYDPPDPCKGATIATTSTVVIDTNPICAPGNIYAGSVTITPLGGTGPYSVSMMPSYPACYTSSPNFNPASFINITTNIIWTDLCAGTYQFRIIDDDGCEGIVSVTLICNPCNLSITTTVSDITCISESGYIDIVVFNGVGPYTYNLIGNTYNYGPVTIAPSNYQFGPLQPDTYVLTVTDTNTGCVATATHTLVAYPPIVITGLVSHVTMFGLNDGSITITVIGGVSPYSYLWSPGGQTSQNLTGIGAGTYTVIITDGSGCDATATFIVEQPPCDISIFGTVSGVTGSPTSTTSTAIATIDVDSATLSDYDGLRFLIDIPDGSGSFGYYEIWFDATGSTSAPTGVSGYTQVEIDISGASTVADIAALIEAGLSLSNITVTRSSDVVTITFDKTGAAALDHATTNGTQTSLLALSLTSQTSCDGSINLYNPVGGIPPYFYSWTGPGGYTATTQDISSLCVGVYCVTVCDSVECCTDMCFLVMPGDCITSEVADDTIQYIHSICKRCGCDVKDTPITEEKPRPINGGGMVSRTADVSRTGSNEFTKYVVIEQNSQVMPPEKFTANAIAPNVSRDLTIDGYAPSSDPNIIYRLPALPTVPNEVKFIIEDSFFGTKNIDDIPILINYIEIAKNNSIKEIATLTKALSDTKLDAINKLVVTNSKFTAPLLSIDVKAISKLSDSAIDSLQEDLDNNKIAANIRKEKKYISDVIDKTVSQEIEDLYEESSDNGGDEEYEEDGGGCEDCPD